MSFSKSTMGQSLNVHLRVLTRNVGRKLDIIHELGLKIKRLGPSFGLAPRLMNRLSAWVAQLGKLQAQEAQILTDICKVEQKHRALREKKMLRQARPSAQPAPIPSASRKKNWVWYFLLLALFLDKAPKKPEHTSKLQNG